MYSNLLQICRGGCTLKEKFSSSRCRRDKNYLFEGSLPPPFMQRYTLKKKFSSSMRQRDISLRLYCWGYTLKNSSCRLVANETKRYFFEAYYFCSLLEGGTKIIYNKSLPVNFVRMLKINTRKLWHIESSKQWGIKTN